MRFPKVFCCNLSSLVLMIKLFCGGRCVAQQLWEPLNYRMIIHPTTQAVVNVTYARYKKLEIGYTGLLVAKYNNLCNADGVTKPDCSNRCFEMTDCITWNFLNGMCRCFDKVFRGQSLTAIEDNNVDCYEMKNPCTENLNLCEHGSICVPDRLARNYSCINCMSPYTGAHCNETGLPTPATIPKDVLHGRNISCSRLSTQFNILKSGTELHWIYPWRDQRKIKVKCSKHFMIVTSLTPTSTSVRELKAEDLMDGLDLTVGHFRAHTSFLNKLEKLIHFDEIRFSCAFINDLTSYWHELKNIKIAVQDNFNAFNYFTGNSNDRPSSNVMSLGTNQKDFTVDPIDRRFSSEGIDYEERTFKNVLLNNNGHHLTFTNETKQCFYNEGIFKRFEILLH